MHVWLGGSLGHGLYVEVGGYLLRVGSLLLSVGARDWTQATGLGGKYLFVLHCLPGPDLYKILKEFTYFVEMRTTKVGEIWWICGFPKNYSLQL